jgi:serine phosphatase RsbU (regulator of sigma subunit)
MVEAANSKKNVLIIFSAIALLMTIVAIAFIYRSYLINKKSAKDLFQKNKLIEEKNKEITDSINYAKNIQSSLLASDEIFSKNVKEHFIFFRPKDIVSGDFYWAQNTEEGFLVMCADCTGHGVPGAFMSLLGISHLKEICGKLKNLKPDRILNELRKQFIENFSLSNSKDGMDASLIKINGMELEMAAANNPIWIIRDNSCIHMKPNKFPIGKHHGEIQEFSLNTLELKNNDLLILFTDGFADQFGGPKNKKYKYKQLEEFILKNSQLPLRNLNAMLEEELKVWKGKNEQIDDVLVIGIRI